MTRRKGRSPLVVVDGVEYPSLERAAKALHLPPYILSLRLSSPDFPTYQRKWVSDDVEYDHLSGRPSPSSFVPVVIDGINYPSITAAAAKLGVSYEAVRYRLSSPDYPNYRRKDEIKRPRTLRTPRTGKPVFVDGVEYPSMREAERALRLPPNVIYTRVSSPSHPNYYRKGESKAPHRWKPGAPKAVIIDGVEYSSITQAVEALRALRLSYQKVRDRANDPTFPNYQWKTEARHGEQ